MKRRNTSQAWLPLRHELIVDNFAGGGGASTGIEAAFGRPLDIAINHDAEAIAMHMANHPDTKHYCEDVFSIDPLEVTGGQPVGLAWFSPDCKHFSKAKGGKPVSKKIRGLAWIVIKWARVVQPRVIMLENVEEFQGWGPLNKDGMPDKLRKGLTFRRWRAQLENAGYKVESKELKACDYGAPTIRKRLYIIARRDGRPIVWPKPTHGPGLIPYRTAAECIDWSIDCPSIFERKRPLKPATLRRIARGLKKFVIDAPKPFIIPLTHQGQRSGHSVDELVNTITGAHRGEQALVTPYLAKWRFDSAGSRCDSPIHTITAGGDMKRPAGAAHALGLIVPTLIQTGYGERKGQLPRSLDIKKPLGTAVSSQKHAVATAYLAKHFTDQGQRPGSSLYEPISTITAVDHHSFVSAQLIGCGGRASQSRPRDVSEPTQTSTSKADVCVVASNLVKLKGTCKDGQPVSESIHTIQAGGTHYAEIRSLLNQGGVDEDVQAAALRVSDFIAEYFYGTSTEGWSLAERLALVTVMVDGIAHLIVDIGMRMLQPPELFLAQGFAPGYVIAPMVNGKRLSKTAQVRMCGNSVSPPVAEALVHENFAHELQYEAVA